VKFCDGVVFVKEFKSKSDEVRRARLNFFLYRDLAK
jgi:hypothetical protein